MEQLTVQREKEFSYSILYRDTFDDLANVCRELKKPLRKVCVITDTHVAPLYLNEVIRALEGAFDMVSSFVLPAGEEHKTLDRIQEIYAHLINERFDRKDMLLALGGGVVGDMTGFAAATYLRGISFIQVPTTLLAQVDSSIGGKTGVDFDRYKNMVGAFHQPLLVYMNISTLCTLDEEQFSCGMGEILKHGLIKDYSYYAWLLFHKKEIIKRELETLREMIYRSNVIKKIVVEDDPTEQGDRALLNLGHTVGHAVERLKDFSLLHGQCVSLGIVVSAYISFQRGYITVEEFARIQNDMRYFGLPIRVGGLQAEDILKVTKSDKKMENGQIKFILLHKLGEAAVDNSVTDEELLDGITVIEEV